MFEDFSGGLNTRTTSTKIKPNQSPDLANVLVDEKPGSLVTRNGMIVAASTVGPGSSALQKITFMKEYLNNNGTRGFFVSDSSKVLFTTDFMTWTLIKSTLTTSSKLRATQGLGWMLFTNGVDAPFVSSGLVAIPLDGNNGYPNAPRGKYPAFWLERFFLFNSTANASGLDWSERISTDGFRLDVINSLAWPVLNHLDIGKDDGFEGSGMDVYRGQLSCHKNNSSIYTIYGTDNFTFQPRRTNAHSGTAVHETIVQSDNLQYYFEKTGVYAYDGGDSVRISDDILPDIEQVVSNLTSIQSEVWDVDTDFRRGTLSNSTVTPAGVLVVIGTLNVAGISATFDGSPPITQIGVSGSTTSGNHNLHPSAIPPIGTPISLALSSGVVWLNQGGTCSDPKYARISFVNTRTGQAVQSSTFSAIDGTHRKQSFSIGNFNFTTADVLAGRVRLKADITQNGDCDFNISTFTVPSGNGGALYVGSTNTASFETEIVTTTVSLWDTFEAVDQTNGGKINYFVRAATSIVQIAREPYVPITPGSIIPFNSSRTYVQAFATISAVNVDVTTTGGVDKMTINWNEGGTSDSSPQGIEWKKRYLLLVSTQAGGTSSAIYVKSKITNSTPNAWVKYTFANDYFKSMATFNNNLYLGSGSTGTIYRFDYGTNDNGIPTTWFYRTPTQQMGKPFFSKNQSEYFVEADKLSNATLQIGTSVNDRAYTYISVSLDGSGRFVRSIKTGFPSVFNYVQYEFKGTQLDKPINFHKFGVFYEPTQVRVNP